MQSGFNAEFLRAWQNEENETIDEVIASLNKGMEKPVWDKKMAQKEAARYRKAGVNLRKFGRQRVNQKIDSSAAQSFLDSLVEV